MTLIFAFLLLVSGLLSSFRAEDEEPSKSSCMERFVRWCDTAVYPRQNDTGVSIISYVYRNANGFNNRVLCLSDYEGTNCSRNGAPWFTCAPDHTLTYKGQPLTLDTPTEDVDDDVCGSASKAFDDLMLQDQKLAFDNETLEEFRRRMDVFNRQMAEFQRRMRELTQRMSGGWPSFFGRDFWSEFDQSTDSPFNASPGTTDESSEVQWDDTKQGEKE